LMLTECASLRSKRMKRMDGGGFKHENAKIRAKGVDFCGGTVGPLLIWAGGLIRASDTQLSDDGLFQCPDITLQALSLSNRFSIARGRCCDTQPLPWRNTSVSAFPREAPSANHVPPVQPHSLSTSTLHSTTSLPNALPHHQHHHNGRPPAKVDLPFTTLPIPSKHHPPKPHVKPPSQIPANTTPRFNQQVLIDTTPLPESIPPVKEIGASSAPLLSASFFIGDRCKAFNDDYMVCKTQAHGKGEIECMREGRKATRCAASV